MWFRRLLHRWRRHRRGRRFYPLIYRPTFEGQSDVYRPSTVDPAPDRDDGTSPEPPHPAKPRPGG